MIGSITGSVLYQNDSHVIIQTNTGIGYKVAYSKKSLAKEAGVFLYTAQTFRENGQDLYGFDTVKDLETFELLCSVKGVGAKSAFSLVNSLGHKNVLNAITFENKKLLSTAPGIGNKAASQIILDLQTKLPKLTWIHLAEECSGADTKNNDSTEYDLKMTEDLVELSDKNNDLFIQDALMACKDLGFKENEILPTIHTIMSKGNISSPEELVQMVLKGI